MRKNGMLKKCLAMNMMLVLVLMSLVGCGTKSEGTKSTGSSGDQTSNTDKVYKIGVCQLVEHDALDASYQGFIDGLKEAGYVEGENLEIDYQNAQGDQSNCATIATKLVNEKVDLILAIATPAAQAVANATQDIPILVTAVTDPAESGLVASNDAPGGNVSGTSDLTPVKEQIELLTQLLPEAKTVAMLYNSSEANSKIQVDMAVKEAEALGLKTVDASVSSSNEIQQVVQSLVNKVDAIYSPTDNLIASNMATVSMVATENKIPIICGEEGMVNEGGLATYGINYYNLGLKTAEQAVKILEGTSTTADMPIEYLEGENLTINQDIANTLGIQIPQELLDKLETTE